MTESKRVVVTGLGCVSPLGNTVAETWEKGSQGQSGIDRIEKFDPSEMRCQIAGEVRNFELPDLVPSKEAKKMDLFIHYAIAATQEALRMQHWRSPNRWKRKSVFPWELVSADWAASKNTPKSSWNRGRNGSAPSSSR